MLTWRKDKKKKQTKELKKKEEMEQETGQEDGQENKQEKEPCWEDYILDDDEFYDAINRIPNEDRIDKQPWLSKEEETRLALRTALLSISNGHDSGRCTMCQKIDISSPYGFGHYRYPALEHSALLGCPLCRFFLGNISKIGNLCSADLTINQKTCDNSVNNSSIFLRGVWSNPFSDGCISVARDWLECCVRDHERCSQGEGFASPTRLLNISKPPPFLCTPEAKNVRYAALSYCWGQDETVSTTKTNIKAHQKGIEYGTLPKTFQDAIVVAQKLDINYLWIDSLCIVQDDNDDWDTECLRMGDYYQNSYVTISALSASGSSEGFLYLRPETPVMRVFENSTFYIRPATTFDRRKVFDSAALSKRGWTLQERLLSTRILHYSSHEMFWECKTCSAREGSAKEHVDPVDSRSLGNSEGDDFKRVLQHMNSNPYSPSHGAFAVWYRLVRQYTRRSLSRPSDRLPAISALAAVFTATTGCSYMAGLWAQDSHGLLWLKDCTQVSHGTYHSYPRESERYRAPSWSWAAVDGAIVFASYDEDRTFSTNDATIIQQTVEPLGSSKYGAVLSGSLTLRALSKRVQCLPYKYDGKWSHLQKYIDGYVGAHCQLDYEYYQVGVPTGRYRLRIFDELGKHFGFGLCDDGDLEELLVECVAVWIGEYIYDGRTPTKAVYFLLLVPDEDEPEKWRRVGLGVTKDDPAFQGFFTSVFDCYEWKTFVLV